jgi:hypothetical protein
MFRLVSFQLHITELEGRMQYLLPNAVYNYFVNPVVGEAYKHAIQYGRNDINQFL